MNIILVFFIAVSLSMDAFSLALAYGTNNIQKKDINLLSIIVGIYHFFMPILGMLIGKFIEYIIHFKSDYITLVIFAFIGFNMIIESLKNETDVKNLKLSEMILFGFAVSIDSFSVGIGINSISNNFLVCSLIFSFTSFIFTYIGLILGNKLNKFIGRFATLIGGISLIILGIFFAK